MTPRKTSRVGSKLMTAEKRGIQNAKGKKLCILDDDIVCSIWKHIAAVVDSTAVTSLRVVTNTKDEEVHLHLFVQMFKTLQAERPEIFTAAFYEKVAVLFDEAAKLETLWGSYIISGGVLGLTDQIIKQYIQWLVDQRLALIDMPALYGVKNPVPWVEKFSRVNDIEQNFFESRVTNYAIGTLNW